MATESVDQATTKAGRSVVGACACDTLRSLANGGLFVARRRKRAGPAAPASLNARWRISAPAVLVVLGTSAAAQFPIDQAPAAGRRHRASPTSSRNARPWCRRPTAARWPGEYVEAVRANARVVAHGSTTADLRRPSQRTSSRSSVFTPRERQVTVLSWKLRIGRPPGCADLRRPAYETASAERVAASRSTIVPRCRENSGLFRGLEFHSSVQQTIGRRSGLAGGAMPAKVAATIQRHGAASCPGDRVPRSAAPLVRIGTALVVLSDAANVARPSARPSSVGASKTRRGSGSARLHRCGGGDSHLQVRRAAVSATSAAVARSGGCRVTNVPSPNGRVRAGKIRSLGDLARALGARVHRTAWVATGDYIF